jgi:CelD/BcsL family acetyltransferase involved in cellulose biosynthesis
MREISKLERRGFRRGPIRPRVEMASSTQVIDRLDDLDSLSAVWDAVSGARASPMQHFIWSRACAETFSADYSLRVLTVGPARRPSAIAPLVGRHGALTRLEMIGVNELYEPMDLCYDSPAALAALAQALADLGIPLVLKRLPAQSPVIPALERAFKGRGMVFLQPMDSCPYIELDERWKEPEQNFNSGRRSDFRRMRRRAEKLGTITYETSTPSRDEVGPLIEEAFRIDGASWRSEDGTALARDGVRGDFFRRYALAACEQGILRLCFLRIGRQAAAMQFAVESGGRFWLLKISHDESFACCSPGLLLMLQTVRYAAERGLRSYEFLGTAAPWTAVWTQLERPCVALLAYPFGMRGLATLAADAAKYAWPKVKNAWRGRE